MNPTPVSPTPELVPGDVDIECFDGWAPAVETAFTCYTMAVESS